MSPAALARKHAEHASALVGVMVFIAVMGVILTALDVYTSSVAFQTANQDEFLRANEAAEAALEVVSGRLIQWVTSNSGFGPSIADCATAGVPGNTTFPAITSAVTFPAGSPLSNYTVSTPTVYPVMPDDTVVTTVTDPKYLPNLATRINVSENSPSSVTCYYFTHSATLNSPNVASKSLTYKITVTVTPNLNSVVIRQPTQLTRYLRCDKVSPFGWCTYRMGSATYNGTQTYSGPLYLANSVTFNGPTYTDSVDYGISATDNSGNFINGGYASQVKQTALLSMIPNLIGNMAVDSNGNRQASFETNTTPPGGGLPAPADIFSTREVIEPPTNPANDLTPDVFKNARIYNQADARIQVLVTTVGTVKTVTKTVVNVNGTAVNPVTNPWVTPLLAAVNVKALADTDPNAFIDRGRSTSSAVESTDINVGALGAVMAAYPAVFTTGIIYAWDATGLSGGTRPLTGVRLWNAGVLPAGGLVVGSNDPIYLKGDFNTGATLPANATIDSSPTAQPYSDSMGHNTAVTTEAQREVPGYTIQPGGVFGDAVTELSYAWRDANSRGTQTAVNNTINLVEGWSTDSANELRSDDTYLDPWGRANPIWIEDWSNARRTMSGEEMCAWHSRYETNNSQPYANWSGDISFDAKAASVRLNWGTVNFVRDRKIRNY
jgi:hypothetical protein